MAEVADVRLAMETLFVTLEIRKLRLMSDKGKLRGGAGELLIGFARNLNLVNMVVLSVLQLGMNFVSNPLPLMSGALLILVIASWGCLVFARIADRRLRCSLEDLKKRESTFLENVNEFAVLIQKSQKVCQSKVAPVSQQDLPVNSGDGPPDMSWLIKLETLECRFELLRSHTPDSGILKGNRVEGIIRFLAVSFVLLGFCMMIVIYRNQDSTDL